MTSPLLSCLHRGGGYCARSEEDIVKFYRNQLWGNLNLWRLLPRKKNTSKTLVSRHHIPHQPKTTHTHSFQSHKTLKKGGFLVFFITFAFDNNFVVTGQNLLIQESWMQSRSQCRARVQIGEFLKFSNELLDTSFFMKIYGSWILTLLSYSLSCVIVEKDQTSAQTVAGHHIARTVGSTFRSVHKSGTPDQQLFCSGFRTFETFETGCNFWNTPCQQLLHGTNNCCPPLPLPIIIIFCWQ